MLAPSAAASTAVVSSPPTPSPTTGSRSARVGSSSSTRCTSETAARQVASQSVKRLEQQARRQLREEVRRLLWHHAALARAREHILDPRRPQQKGRLGLAAIDRGDGLRTLRRVRHTLRPERVDDLDVETLALDELVPAPAVQHD